MILFPYVVKLHLHHSIAMGGAPVQIPDFTLGKWILQEEPIKTKYGLDVIGADPHTPIY